jgi:hypothetical protein
MQNDDLDIGADGEFAPYLKFNAKSNEWSWHGEDGASVLASPRFVMDLVNIQTAWVRFDEGSAPDYAIDPAPGERAERPTERHKRGFLVRVCSKSSFRGTGDFASNAVGVCNAVREIYRQYRQKAGEHPGEVPVISVTGSASFKGRYGTNYSPNLQITGWIRRPADLPDEPVIAVKTRRGNGSVEPPRRGQTTDEAARQTAEGWSQSGDDEFADLDDDAIPY